MPAWLTTVAWISLGLSAASALVILGDIVAGRRQPMAVMNIVWPITGLYFGPFGLWAYWALGRPKAGQAHHGGRKQGDSGPSKPANPTPAQVFVATSHCGAGCVLGDVTGEVALAATGLVLFGSPLLTAFAVDFALAYAFGIVFQYFTIAPMRGLGLKDGLVAAIKADTLSLIAFEVGMFGWMALTRLVLFEDPPGPETASYWFLMQVAMVVGFGTSLPGELVAAPRGAEGGDVTPQPTSGTSSPPVRSISFQPARSITSSK